VQYWVRRGGKSGAGSLHPRKGEQGRCARKVDFERDPVKYYSAFLVFGGYRVKYYTMFMILGEYRVKYYTIFDGLAILSGEILHDIHGPRRISGERLHDVLWP